jgi:hypothetical protein
MKNFLAGFGVAVLIACALIVFQQRQAQDKLRAEDESMRRQIAQLKADNEKLSNFAAQTKSSSSLPDDQFNELLKLRGEVGLLRRQVDDLCQQTNSLGKLRDENQQLQARDAAAQNQLDQIAAEAAFKQHRIDVANAMKQLGLAMRIYAGDHNEQYATNFDQLKDELGGVTNFQGNIGFDTFDFMNVGLVNDTMPDKLIFREKAPRQISNGEWERVYGLSDGSVQTVKSDDINFTVWEQQHSPPPGQ